MGGRVCVGTGLSSGPALYSVEYILCIRMIDL